MSSKKSAEKRTPRTIARSDFRKLTPTELEKLGYSRKAERFLDIKNVSGKAGADKTISKRNFAKAFFGISNEAKAEAIKKGARPILDNAPKKARTARIQKAAEKRAASPSKLSKAKAKQAPVKILTLPDNKLRYDYDLNMYLITSWVSGNEIAFDYLTSELNKIFSSHPRLSQWRMTLSDGKNGTSTDMQLIVRPQTATEDLLGVLESFLTGQKFDTGIRSAEWLSGIDIGSPNIKITLKIYGV